MNEVSLVNLQRILDFLSLRNLASNELFFILFISLQQPLYKNSILVIFYLNNIIHISLILSFILSFIMKYAVIVPKIYGNNLIINPTKILTIDVFSLLISFFTSNISSCLSSILSFLLIRIFQLL
ncbi:hypothetical protein CI111_06160 [Fusobacterium animalis]|uniref:Uncharacterized protein n=1 Tax=Fusobacterium animalis TaxID=76859 RepID=A0A2G9FJD6_9FUSO|nr:hypothetical protein CI111_06160 [Fusobacterium animalis]PIM93517.1 hypothetical protein CI114_00950 [Fusobacterium animalis]